MVGVSYRIFRVFKKITLWYSMSLGSIQLFSSENCNSRNLPSDCRVVGSNPPPYKKFYLWKKWFSLSQIKFFGLTFDSPGEIAPKLAKISPKTWFDLKKITFSEVKFLVVRGSNPPPPPTSTRQITILLVANVYLCGIVWHCIKNGLLILGTPYLFNFKLF